MLSGIFRNVDTVAERHRRSHQTTDLAPGEVVLWQGRPKRGIVFSARAMWHVFILIYVAAIAVGSQWTRGQLPVGTTRFAELHSFDVFLIVALAYFTVGHFVLDAYYRAHLTYIATNRRVIISRYGLGRFVRSIYADKWSLSLQRCADGRGTINLRSDRWWTWMKNWNQEFVSDARGPYLYRVKDARSVYEILRKAQAEALTRPVASP